MHGALWNELELVVRLRPDTPLLIKAGGDASIVEPVLADMQLVRAHRNGQEEPFIPGSSLRGPLRAHAEKLVRAIRPSQACAVIDTSRENRGTLRKSCVVTIGGGSDPVRAYHASCYVCRLFGNTHVASRVRFSDLFTDPEQPTLLATRASVAIDRVTGAVGKGPFEMEVASDGIFQGTVTLRNFTLGQLGLFAAVWLDLQDGMISLGYGKSRGLGRVKVEFAGRLRLFGPQALALPPRTLAGVEALADPVTRERYFPGNPGSSTVEVPFTFERRRLALEASPNHDAVTQLFEQVAPLWVEEVERLDH